MTKKRTLAERKAQYEHDKATGNLPKGEPMSIEKQQEILEHVRKERNSPRALEAQALRRYQSRHY